MQPWWQNDETDASAASFMDVGDEAAPARFTAKTTKNEITRFMEAASASVLHGDEVLDHNDDNSDLELLMHLALSRVAEAQNPSPSEPARGMDHAQEMLARKYEVDRLKSSVGAIQKIYHDRAYLKALADKHPELQDIGLNQSWFDRLKEVSVAGARKGWRGLDILLRNLDRGRGAIANYAITKQKGGTEEEAKRAAFSALTGTEKGWRWVPEIQGPSFSEVLRAAGMENGLARGALGFGMDILADPVSLLGVGASRHGVEVAGHQVLNRYGREVYGKVLGKHIAEAVRSSGVANEIALAPEFIDLAHANAAADMRGMINSSKDSAYNLLDMGGLKIAGYTLPASSFLTKKQVIRGGVEYDYVPENLAKFFGKKVMGSMDRLGAASEGKEGIAARVGQFVGMLPAWLREAGRAVGTMANRTNPLAGKEYGWFKQAEYYEKLGYGKLQAIEAVYGMFDGVTLDDLTSLSHAMEAGPQVEAAFIGKQAASRGKEYGQRLSTATAAYRSAMDEIVIDEVKRGFYGEGWTDMRKQLFEQWVRSGGRLQLPDSELKMFAKARKENYVAHIYNNIPLARKAYAPPQLGPRAPSIVEPFVKRRLYPTLASAQAAGLVPETNISTIAAIRIIAHSNAAVTQDFLRKLVERSSAGRAGLIGAGADLVRNAGMPRPKRVWEDVYNARLNASGKAAIPIDRQIEMARAMAIEARVPLKAVGKLEDRAISEFLKHRLRVNTIGKGEKVWSKYVERATREGHYDGYRLAPAATANDAIAVARDLVDPAYPHWVPFTAGGIKDPEYLKNAMIPVEFADDLARLKGTPLPDEIIRFLRVYDALNNSWKRSVTIFWPAFHVRNKITNVVNSAMDIGLAGVLDRGTLLKVMRGHDGVLSTPGGRYSYSQVRKLARIHGVSRPFYRRVDVTGIIEDVIANEAKEATGIARKLKIKLAGRDELLKRGELIGPRSISATNPFRAGSETGALIENHDRMQLFIKSLERGMSPSQAARRVNQFLFDYEDVSSVDRNYIRRFFNPFFTYTKKNLYLQSKLALTMPGRFIAPSKFARALSDEKDDAMRSDVERDLLQRYLNDHFAIRAEAGYPLSKWLMNVDLPAGDLDRLWEGKLKTSLQGWMASIGPYAKEMFETAAETDFFTGAKRVEFIRGTKAYDMMKGLKGTPIGDFLELHEEQRRDKTTVYVNPARWRAVMWMTGWQLSRLYSTVGRLTNDGSGSITARLFNALTGMRFEYVNAPDEIRRNADQIIFNEDTGQRENLVKMIRQAEDRLGLNSLEAKEAEEQLDASHKASSTPVVATELDEHDTWDWHEAE